MKFNGFRPRPPRLVVGLVAALLLTAASDARAQPSVAAEHAKKAQLAYDVQNWPGAIQEYQAAYQAEPKPDFLWGLAQAQRGAGDFTSAIKSYKAFKRSDSVSGSASLAADQQIAKCESEIEKKQAEAAKKPEPAPGPAPAGTAAPAPSATPPPPPPESPKPKVPSGPKPFYADVLGDTLFVAGAAAGGIGAFFLLTGNSDMTKSASLPLYQDYDKAVDDAKSKQTLGSILLAGGGVFLGLAVVRWVTMDKGGAASAPQQGLLVGPGSVGYTSRF